MQKKIEREEKSNGLARFAPAPTGDMHIGHLWTCYTNFRLVKKVILRLDNTNCPLFERDYNFLKKVTNIFRLFGFRFSKVVIQSFRLRRYRIWACLYLRPYIFMKDGALYYRSSGQESIFFDRIRQRDIKKIIPKDIVLIRGNGYPTYHLASLCDDYIGNVTDIIRSSDHIDSTLIHHLVFNRIGSIKRFWIIPLIYDENKQKLSKSRQDTLSLETLIRKEGILPQTFLGYFNEHKDSHRPFQFDINILKRMNRKYMTYNNIIEVIHKGLQSLYGKINVINLAYFKDLIDSGRYTNLNQLMIEIDILKPALDRLLDHYISNNLDRFWMNLLQNWFDKREISTLNTEHKIYFRENLLNLNKGPSIEECLKILFLIFKDRDDDEEESKQVQN